jgi:hypothetical protein
VLVERRLTAIENPIRRADNYGNLVFDRAVLMFSTKRARPELYSIIPKGDVNSPKSKRATPESSPL